MLRDSDGRSTDRERRPSFRRLFLVGEVPGRPHADRAESDDYDPERHAINLLWGSDSSVAEDNSDVYAIPRLGFDYTVIDHLRSAARSVT